MVIYKLGIEILIKVTITHHSRYAVKSSYDIEHQKNMASPWKYLMCYRWSIRVH